MSVLASMIIKLLFIFGFRRYSISKEYAMAGIIVNSSAKNEKKPMIESAPPGPIFELKKSPEPMAMVSINNGTAVVGIKAPRIIRAFLPLGSIAIPFMYG